MDELKEVSWIEAIKKIFIQERRSMHYTEITELIIENKLRVSLGATPSMTVNRILTTNSDKFVRTDAGFYILKDLLEIQNDRSVELKNEKINNKKVSVTVNEAYLSSLEPNILTKSIGVYWNRDNILWKNEPDMFGVQKEGANPVNFKNQIGIYILFDQREIIYVGQAIDQPISKRLMQHTNDRLSGRWNRFSWFGFFGVAENGELYIDAKKYEHVAFSELADTLEGVLIESIEPRQNRKKGNSFASLEFMQFEDPAILRKKKQQLLKELSEII